MAPYDAEQTAMIGLIEAAESFEPELDYQFSTHVSYRLRQVCQRFSSERDKHLAVYSQLKKRNVVRYTNLLKGRSFKRTIADFESYSN